MQFVQDVKIQTKKELIANSTFIDLIKALILQFYLHNSFLSSHRVLVYRDGVSEASYDQAKKLEIQSIRTAFYEFLRDRPGSNHNCTANCGNACVFCCPPITYICCMMQLNIRIVTETREYGVKDNVFSGACVDHTIIDLRNISLSDNEQMKRYKMPHMKLFSEPQGGFDFLLIAQGGLKRTSKPIYYHVILMKMFCGLLEMVEHHH